MFGIATQKLACEHIQKGEEVFLYTFDYFNEKSLGPLGWFMPFKGRPPSTLIEWEEREKHWFLLGEEKTQ